MTEDRESPQETLWVCYCSVVAPFRAYVFPHEDCQGGRPVRPDETDLLARKREHG